MNVISFAADKFVSFRLEGIDRETAFGLTKFETHRFLMDFVYYSGEPMADKTYSEMIYVLDDIRFTQQAEFQFEKCSRKIKSPA